MAPGAAARYNNSLAAQGDQPLGAVLHGATSVRLGLIWVKKPILPSCWIPEKFNLLLLHSSYLLCLCHILSMRFLFFYCHSIPIPIPILPLCNY